MCCHMGGRSNCRGERSGRGGLGRGRGGGGRAGARITSAQIDILSLLINLVQLRRYQKAAYDLLVCHLSAEHGAHPLVIAPTLTQGRSRACVLVPLHTRNVELHVWVSSFLHVNL